MAGKHVECDHQCKAMWQAGKVVFQAKPGHVEVWNGGKPMLDGKPLRQVLPYRIAGKTAELWIADETGG